MTNPIPGAAIGTPFKQSGSWSCGWHTGVDIRGSNGTQIYAPIDGVIKHRNHGSALGNHQFTITPNADQPFGAGEVLFAHTSDRPPDGTVVKMGDPIAHVGWEGNVKPKSPAGAHLHFEYHPDTKGVWSCSACKDPQPILSYKAGQAPPVPPPTTPGGGSGGPAPTSPAPDEEDDDGSSSKKASVSTQNLSGLPFRFNPVIHPSLSHVIPDYQIPGVVADTNDPINDELGSVYGADVDYSKYRLGRIMMAKEAYSYVRVPFGERYGFRFLYNPESVVGGTMVNGSFKVSPNKPLLIPMMEGLEVISIDLLLNRMPEVQGQAKPEDFIPKISQEELNKLKKYGTKWDLEYLYRCSNGMHGVRSHNEPTGDIGVLLANPVNLILGTIRTWGALLQIEATDVLFSDKLVPMLTNVNIQFTRYIMPVGQGLAGLMDQDQDGTTAAPTDPAADPAAPAAPTPGGPPTPNNDTDKGGPGNEAASDGSWKKGMPTTNAPSLTKLRDEIDKKWPARKKYNDGTLSGNAAHWDDFGQHNPVGWVHGPKYGTRGSVHARDITMDGADVDACLAAVIKDHRVWYVISKRSIYSRTHGWAKQVYNGGTDASHDHHIHVSLNAPDQATAVKNENDTGSWF